MLFFKLHWHSNLWTINNPSYFCRYPNSNEIWFKERISISPNSQEDDDDDDEDDDDDDDVGSLDGEKSGFDDIAVPIASALAGPIGGAAVLIASALAGPIGGAAVKPVFRKFTELIQRQVNFFVSYELYLCICGKVSLNKIPFL